MVKTRVKISAGKLRQLIIASVNKFVLMKKQTVDTSERNITLILEDTGIKSIVNIYSSRL